MSGALNQLVAVGKQDAFITGDNLDNSVWRNVTKKVSNFAMESIENYINVNPGSTTSIVVGRFGDLVRKVTLEITMKKGSTTNPFYPSEQYVKYAHLSIGGQIVYRIDDFPTWTRVHEELFMDPDTRATNQRVNNFRPEDPVGAIRKFYLDIPLFFTDDASKALPLIALQYHEVKLDVLFASPGDIPGIDASYTPTVECYIDYVFLDTPEREWFARNTHMYVIEQLQHYNNVFSVAAVEQTKRLNLPFTMPTRYLIWLLKTGADGVYTTSGYPFENNDSYAAIKSAKLQFNGTDRFSERPGYYFTTVQPQDAFGRSPSAGIYVYSFGLDVTGMTSKGALNFSRMDNATLSITTKAATAATISDVYNQSTTLASAITDFTSIAIYAKSFNVLKIDYGMGGMLFAN